ncbi:phosphate ABC transporter permease subunit PstC [Aestuariivirga sp.]|uniref:phosphate ABC transporter permease subunit PstC n=1 Tax=Aestuariivirga sp. TaxID=2650926 RepID=UPI003015D811
MFFLTVLLIVLMAVIAYWAGRSHAAGLVTAGGARLHSLPSYHGLFTAAGAMIGGLALAIAGAFVFGAQSLLTPVAAVIGAAIGAFPLYSKSSLDVRARNNFERVVLVLLIACSGVAILTTVGIVFSVLFETVIFFRSVSPIEFLFGTHWSPTGTPASFGFIPLLTGTLLITVIAIAVAGPLGLLSAIYMAEYASPRLRSFLKPILEILAGIPTVVLGFFAALTVAPLIRASGESMGLSVASESALAAGLVMGMMIVPLISSLSDDIINAVPQSLRDGSYAMGATKSETIKKVVLPAALPGIVSAFMLAISRAIGETMIVVMAAGLAANLTANPLAAVTTITVQIATLLVGDQEFDSPKTLSAFALGFVLFIFTLVLNYIALRIVQKYREQYD